jgi:hypothetical protein
MFGRATRPSGRHSRFRRLGSLNPSPVSGRTGILILLGPGLRPGLTRRLRLRPGLARRLRLRPGLARRLRLRPGLARRLRLRP